jgi:hypothetical protein
MVVLAMVGAVAVFLLYRHSHSSGAGGSATPHSPVVTTAVSPADISKPGSSSLRPAPGAVGAPAAAQLPAPAVRLPPYVAPLPAHANVGAFPGSAAPVGVPNPFAAG